MEIDRSGISKKYSEIKSFNNVFRLIGDITLEIFSENKAWKEFQLVIVEYK